MRQEIKDPCAFLAIVSHEVTYSNKYNIIILIAFSTKGSACEARHIPKPETMKLQKMTSFFEKLGITLYNEPMCGFIVGFFMHVHATRLG